MLVLPRGLRKHSRWVFGLLRVVRRRLLQDRRYSNLLLVWGELLWLLGLRCRHLQVGRWHRYVHGVLNWLHDLDLSRYRSNFRFAVPVLRSWICRHCELGQHR